MGQVGTLGSGTQRPLRECALAGAGPTPLVSISQTVKIGAGEAFVIVYMIWLSASGVDSLKKRVHLRHCRKCLGRKFASDEGKKDAGMKKRSSKHCQ